MPDLDEIYRGARERVVERIASLPADALAHQVPGCPAWTVHGLLAHLASLPSLAVSGQLKGIPSDEFTTEQVRLRADRTVPELVDEWTTGALEIDAGLREGKYGRLPHDAVVHEADLHGAVQTGRPPLEAWQFSFTTMLSVLDRRLHDIATLHLTAGDLVLDLGSGTEQVSLSVDQYEMWRAIFGRRSRAQVRAWAWNPVNEDVLDRIAVFGPTETDLTEPA